MDKPDPLREVGNCPENNETQDAAKAKNQENTQMEVKPDNKENNEPEECKDKVVDQEKEDSSVPPAITKVPALPFDGAPVNPDVKAVLDIDVKDEQLYEADLEKPKDIEKEDSEKVDTNKSGSDIEIPAETVEKQEVKSDIEITLIQHSKKQKEEEVETLKTDNKIVGESEDKIVNQEKEDSNVPPDIIKVPALRFDGAPVNPDIRAVLDISVKDEQLHEVQLEKAKDIVKEDYEKFDTDNIAKNIEIAVETIEEQEVKSDIETIITQHIEKQKEEKVETLQTDNKIVGECEDKIVAQEKKDSNVPPEIIRVPALRFDGTAVNPEVKTILDIDVKDEPLYKVELEKSKHIDKEYYERFDTKKCASDTEIPVETVNEQKVKSDIKIIITQHIEKLQEDEVETLKTDNKIDECIQDIIQDIQMVDTKKEVVLSDTDTTVSDLSLSDNILSTEGEVSETDLEVRTIAASLAKLGPDCVKEGRVISDTANNIKMADLRDKLNKLKQENSELKLQLKASQQAKAMLELEILQKEEVIMNIRAELLKREEMHKQEIKQLEEKLKEKDPSKVLEEHIKEAKAREARTLTNLHQSYQEIMEQYDNTLATRYAEYNKLKEEHETATRHLANMELAFSDLHQKYEKTKAVVLGFKSNEDILKQDLQNSDKKCKQHEERFESLKAHAKTQIENANKELLQLRDKYEEDINKLKTVIKRLEIKCSSLDTSLQQKTEECAALSALCEEVTGNRL